MSGFICA